MQLRIYDYGSEGLVLKWPSVGWFGLALGGFFLLAAACIFIFSMIPDPQFGTFIVVLIPAVAGAMLAGGTHMLIINSQSVTEHITRCFFIKTQRNYSSDEFSHIEVRLVGVMNSGEAGMSSSSTVYATVLVSKSGYIDKELTLCLPSRKPKKEEKFWFEVNRIANVLCKEVVYRPE